MDGLNKVDNTDKVGKEKVDKDRVDKVDKVEKDKVDKDNVD